MSSPAPPAFGSGGGGGAGRGGEGEHGVRLGNARESIVKPLSATSAAATSSSFAASTSEPSLLASSVPASSSSSPGRDATTVGVSGKTFRESTADWLMGEAMRQRSRGGGSGGGRLGLRQRQRRQTLLGRGSEEEEGEKKTKEIGEEGGAGVEEEVEGEVEDEGDEGDPFGRARYRSKLASASSSTYSRSSFSTRGGRFSASPESSRPRSNDSGGDITSLTRLENASVGRKEKADWEVTATPKIPTRSRVGAVDREEGHVLAELVSLGVGWVGLEVAVEERRMAFEEWRGGRSSVYGVVCQQRPTIMYIYIVGSQTGGCKSFIYQ